jgi:hypothetical protein
MDALKVKDFNLSHVLVTGAHGYYPPDWTDKEGFSLEAWRLQAPAQIGSVGVLCANSDPDYLRGWVLPHLRLIVERLEDIYDHGDHFPALGITIRRAVALYPVDDGGPHIDPAEARRNHLLDQSLDDQDDIPY